jgi:hypothetical protein
MRRPTRAELGTTTPLRKRLHHMCGDAQHGLVGRRLLLGTLGLGTEQVLHPTSPAHRDEERWAREKKGNYWDGEQAARRTWPQVRAHFYFHDQRVHVTRRAARCPLGIGNFYPAVLDRVVRPWPHESRGLGSVC